MKTYMQRQTLKYGFTVIETMVALSVVVFGIILSITIFRNIEKSSAKSQELTRLINLDSMVQMSLEDVRNYVNYRPALKAGNYPSSQMIFNFYKGSVAKRIAVFDAPGAANTLFFNDKLESCDSLVTATADCPYAVHIDLEIIAPTTIPPKPAIVKITTRVEKIQGLTKGSSPISNFSSPSEPFIVPLGFYDDTNNLQCPKDGKKYVGIKNFNVSTGVVDCWEMKTTSCPQGTYAEGLEVESVAPPILRPKCKAFYSYSCPTGYAPTVFYPIDHSSVSLVGACVNIKDDFVSLRLEHIAAPLVPKALPRYGLRWVDARVCPVGYEPVPSANFVNSFRDAFSVSDAISRNPLKCLNVKPVCGSYLSDASKPNEGPKFYCDLCPVSTGFSTANGCPQRPAAFNTPLSSAIDLNCPDPNLIGIDKFALTSSFKCKLIESGTVDGT